MRVLILGNGGRESALSWKISQSDKVSKVFLVPGGGIPFSKCENIPISLQNHQEIINFVRENHIDLTVVGPEGPLCQGIVDCFKKENLKIFGPDYQCSMLEKSKYFTKVFLEKYGIETAKYKICKNLEEARLQIDSFSLPIVVKADGLCLGKGVKVCKTREEAEQFLHQIFVEGIFHEERNQVVLEECLHGRECSLLCFVSHNKIFPMETAQDYKRIFEEDAGPNTGGVGAFSPSNVISQEDVDIKKMLQQIEEGFHQEGFDYTGILFIGLMVGNSPKVLEFNVRFGDPETEVILPRMDFDLVEVMEKTLMGNLQQQDLKWKSSPCLGVVATSKGYPGAYQKGKEIAGHDCLSKDVIFFQNGVEERDHKLFTNGGRVFTLVAMGETIDQAREKVYENLKRISFEGMCYRKDIGLKKEKSPIL